MEPLRSKNEHDSFPNSVTGADRILRSSTESNVFNNDSLDTDKINRKYANKCRCFADPAGECFACEGLACAKHLHHCFEFSCGMPLCNEHTYFVDLENHGKVPMCKKHYRAIKRKIRNMRIGKFLLSPFVDFGE